MSDDEAVEELAGLPVITFGTLPACEAWFAAHHADHRGIWLKIGRAGVAETVTYAEALDVALCHGWIDGQKRGHDEAYWLQRFTPRGPRSAWSQVNRDKAEALIAAGRMRPAGQAQVDAARADGRWAAAYAGQKNATVPDDLAAALAADPRAEAFFETLSRANRYAMLYRVHGAKKPETRAARIATFVEMCHNHVTLH
ncbi:YdeI/OmpD-associated family protein [Terrabacter carboxydivorans]|uniref:YdeI family protein n=1 Tax=Terrabacter carboxydivorans TaxID=619730 RepID=A0ABP5YTV7_9MICO